MTPSVERHASSGAGRPSSREDRGITCPRQNQSTAFKPIVLNNLAGLPRLGPRPVLNLLPHPIGVESLFTAALRTPVMADEKRSRCDQPTKHMGLRGGLLFAPRCL